MISRLLTVSPALVASSCKVVNSLECGALAKLYYEGKILYGSEFFEFPISCYSKSDVMCAIDKSFVRELQTVLKTEALRKAILRYKSATDDGSKVISELA